MKPLHRALGAKNWLAEPEHAHRFPDWRTVNRYYEPFFFGGSVFWRIVAESEAFKEGKIAVVLGDSNPFVCDLLLAVRDYPLELIAEMDRRPSNEETFHAARARLNAWIKRERSVERAALVPRAADFWAMMTLGFNGLWRVNQEGAINVPMGRHASGKLAPMPKPAVVMAAHRALVRGRAEIRHGDFAEQLADVEEGDAIYIDPPYVGTFTGYGIGGFTSETPPQVDMFEPKKKSDIERLRDVCDEIDRRGARFLKSNMDCDRVRELFGRYTIDRVKVRHDASCDAETRGVVAEVLISNRPSRAK